MKPALVSDVKKALETIGFGKVIKVDEKPETGNAKQEDLQILDRSPSILVEVKGISGLPRENDTLQVVKYIPRRTKEWNRTDVCGASIINHQKYLPPLDRANETAFTQQQVEDAKHRDIVLLTTWELFQFVRGLSKFGWPQSAVQNLFYANGRIAPVPANYRLVGKVSHYYDELAVVIIELCDELKIGDTVGYALPTGFVQESVTSLQVDQKPVSEAHAGQSVGHKTLRPRTELKDGLPVYVVEPEVRHKG